MIPHPLLAAALLTLTLALAVAFVIGAAARALILAAVRHREPARHAAAPPPRRVFERTGPPPGDKDQREAAYAELRALPAPGLDYISDRTVVLPFTPPAGIVEPPSAAYAHAATGTTWPAVLLPPPPETSPAGPVPGMTPNPSAPGGSSTGHHTANPRENQVSDRLGTPPGPDADVAEWRHILAPAERLASDTDVRASVCHCGRPAGHLAEALAGDHPETAFDTGVIPAVTGA